MDRILDCKVCGKRFVALRRDAVACSPRCRKKLSRSNAAICDIAEPSDVTDRVTLPIVPTDSLEPVGTMDTVVSTQRTGWLPLAAVPLPPEPPAPPPKVAVPTRVDPMFGRLEDYVQCETPEAAAHWNVTQWRSTDDR